MPSAHSRLRAESPFGTPYYHNRTLRRATGFRGASRHRAPRMGDSALVRPSVWTRSLGNALAVSPLVSQRDSSSVGVGPPSIVGIGPWFAVPARAKIVSGESSTRLFKGEMSDGAGGGHSMRYPRVRWAGARPVAAGSVVFPARSLASRSPQPRPGVPDAGAPRAAWRWYLLSRRSLCCAWRC